MKLDFGPLSTPKVDMSTDSISTNIESYVDFMVENTSGEFNRAFQLQTNLEIAVDIGFVSNSTGTYVEATINTDKSKFTEFDYKYSEIGVIDLGPLEGAADEVIDLVASYVNNWLDHLGGFRIPLPDWLVLKDTSLEFRNGFMEFDATPDITALIDYLEGQE
ncbi:MAG: hypothetical protein V2I33_16755 [Kangiellaceae bacterium]|jgi:hypothetical protein|nr:hypothetical protein [Kangiellaceae bacterium]